MTKYKIQVTQEDIDEGMPRASRCPIALATRRATGCDVMVSSRQIHLDNKRYALPLEAVNFITNFDTKYLEFVMKIHRALIVEPIIFEMVLPETLDFWVKRKWNELCSAVYEFWHGSN